MSKSQNKPKRVIKLPRYHAAGNLTVKVGIPTMEIIVSDPEIGVSASTSIGVDKLIPLLIGCFEYIIITIDSSISLYRELLENYEKLPRNMKNKEIKEELEKNLNTLVKIRENLPLVNNMDVILDIVELLEKALFNPKIQPYMEYLLSHSNPGHVRGFL